MGILKRFGEMYRELRRREIPSDICEVCGENWTSILRLVNAIAFFHQGFPKVSNYLYFHAKLWYSYFIKENNFSSAPLPRLSK